MSSNNENLAMQRIAKLVDENSFMEIKKVTDDVVESINEFVEKIK